jgi:hypothetical protein
MRWVLIVLGVLVGLVALMALVGALHPREHVAGSAVTLHQPPESVWAVVRDIGAVPSWWQEVKSSTRVADRDGREAWFQTLRNNFTMPLVIEAADPPRRLTTLIDSPAGAAFGGRWVYEIEPVPEGSRVRIIERGWVANPLFRFLSRFVFGYHGTQRSYLRALGGRFGEDVTPVHERVES